MFDTSLRAYLRERLGLTKTPLNLLVAIIQLSKNEHGYCWARLRALGQRIECAARTVRAALKRLRELGLVHTRSTGRGLVSTPDWEALGLDPDTAAPASNAGCTAPSIDVPAEPAPKSNPEAEDRPHPGAATSAPVAVTHAQTTEPVHVDLEPALTAVRQRFGDQAARDVAAILSDDPHATRSDAARIALERLLTVEPSHIKHTVGGYFRSLYGVAKDGRLTPSSRCPSSAPPSPPDPIEQALKAQAELVHTLERKIERTELDSDERTQLTHQRHHAIDQLAVLHRRKDARDAPTLKSPSEAPPHRPPPRMSGPAPAWAVKLIPGEDVSPPRPP